MKKLLAVLATASLASSAMATEYKWNGAFTTFLTQLDNYDGDKNANDSSDDLASYLDLKLDILKSDSLNVHVNLRNINYWGSTANFDGSNNTKKDQNSKGNHLVLQEAFANWKMSETTSLKIGRGGMELAGGELVSKNLFDDHLTAFDGILLTHELEQVRLNAFYVRGADFRTADQYNDEADAGGFTGTGSYQDTPANWDTKHGTFYGLTAEIKVLPAFLSSLNVHYVAANSPEVAVAGVDKRERTWLGLSTKGETAGVDYRLAFVQFNLDNTTDDVKEDATMIDLEVGYTMANLNNFRIAGVYHTDGEHYDAFHYNAHDNAGLMDVVGWGNLTEMAVKLSVDAMADLNVMASYHMFTQTEKDVGTADEDEIGTEMNLSVTKKYDNSMYAKVEYGQFEFGKEYGDDTDNATRIYVETGFEF